MSPKTLYHRILSIILMGFVFLSAFSQDIVQPQDVSYAKVLSLNEDKDTIFIENATDFNAEAGDIILVIQMKGAYHSFCGSPTLDKPDSPTVNCYGNTGVYELVQIESINISDSYVVLTRRLERDYDEGEAIQIVKAGFYFNDTEVNNDIIVTPWDSAKGYGGIFPIIAYRKLTLNADIIADAAGFMGGQSDSISQDWTCAPADEEFFYLQSEVSLGALKGEGYLSENYFRHTRGRGYAANGGGAGYGRYAGGSGGANFGNGGYGGRQMLECEEVSFVGGNHAGRFSDVIYGNEYNKIVLGGGGGAAPQDYPSGPRNTPGGNGGGIILIICDTIEGAGGMLSARGGDVTGLATAGAAAGGGGGVVVLDARALINSITVDVSGGKGGDADTSVCVASGGGGGGGVFWHSWEITPPEINTIINGGAGGSLNEDGDCIFLTGWNGDPGAALDSVNVPLNGFFFNSIRGNDVICGGMRPDTIRGTEPKGGNGDFDFDWQSSIDGVTWSSYPFDPADTINFQPEVLYDTTWFRRLVTFEGVTDTSVAVRIDVWPQVLNNIISNNHTICEADMANTLTGDVVTGGDDSFIYQWQRSTDLSNWTAVQETNASDPYDPGHLYDTSYYRRYVQSVEVCQDTSNIVTIQVQPALENYNILSDHQSCFGFPADTLTGVNGLTGGDLQDYYFYWQKREENASWESINNDSTISYLYPGIVDDTTRYRRIVESGMCIDTSNLVTIQVLDQIGNNLIEADQKICYATEANGLTDNGELTGGNKVDYNFIWEYSNNRNEWTEPSENEAKTYDPGVLRDTTFFRRITNSSACWDTSNYVKITVVPQIFNPVTFADTTICQHYYPNEFAENPATGGNNVFDYTWQQSTNLMNWQNAEGEENNISYQAPILQDTTYYRRMVQSDICTVYSDTIKITVMPEIENNLIDEAPMTYTCYEIPKLLAATEPIGGEGVYRYLWEDSRIIGSWDAAIGEDSISMEYRTPALQDSMYYRRIVKSGEYNQCMDTSAYILVRINPLPTGILSDVDTMVCDLQPVPLDVSFSGEAPWRVYLSDGTDYTMNDESGVITKSYDSTNVSRLVSLVIDSLVDANGCRATNLVGLTRIASYENPAPEILAAPNACENQSQVIAKAPKFPAHWKGDNLHFLDSTSVNTLVISSIYDLPQSAIWYEINNFCAEADTADIIFYKQPVAETTFGDTTIHHTFHLELETPEPEYDSVVWYALQDEVNIIDAGATYADFVFPYEAYDNYTLIYRINNGLCYASDTLSITMKDIHYPNAFSPNGDGINDYFYIEGIDDEENKKLTIINPWGNIVFTEPNYTSENRWDGKDMDGRDLPEGTYYYIFETDNKKPEKGFIILKRSEAGN